MHPIRRPSSRARGGRLRALTVVTATAMLAVSGTVGVLLPSPALADTAPAQGTPATVSADALPTVQINGVVWSQVTVGNTVYATGSFTSARPAGSPAGSNETPRAYLLAYDITTGNLITSFNHTLDAQGLVVRATPDGSKVYVAGDFTKVDGIAHNHVAAFKTSDGSLLSSFSGGVNGKVRALAVTNTAVYAGGNFTAAGGAARTHLGALNVTTGAPLAWAPTADDNSVMAMVMTPDNSKVIVGGTFTTLNGTSAYGLGALDAGSGATLPWAANQSVQDAGSSAGINSLRTDGSQIYGTGFVFGAGGNFEGTFAADPGTGAVNWVEDCHGDSYDTAVVGSVLYTITHAHNCATIGAFPETSPRTNHFATSYTTYPTQTVGHNTQGGYKDWYGTPAPTQLDWYPTFIQGTYTGQNQAAWSTTGNASYLALGGEFPTVNGAAQQGLVRFAITSIAPNKVAAKAAGLTPAVVSQSSGTARVAWQATWDMDNESLTYKVVRDGKTATPVYTTTLSSRFYNLPSMGFTDTGLVPGSSHSYRVFASDAFGNTATSGSTTVTVSSTVPGPYVNDVKNDGASNYWRLGETAGTTGYDYAAYNDLVEQPGVGHGAAGAIGGDSDAASTFDGSTSGTASTTSPIDGPNTFSLEAWVKTTTTSGGKIIGFGNAATGNSNNYDRHLYMDNAGHLIFGVYSGGTRTVSGAGTYNDGQWHHVVGELSASTGMVLYVDGLRVGRDAGTTTSTPNNGYWRIGGDNLGGWPAAPSSNQLAGTIDDVAVYPTALSQAQVRTHVTDSGRTVNVPPAPTDTYGKAVSADGPDLFWRLDDAAGPTAADSTGGNTVGNYSADGITYRQPSTVTGSTGTGVRLDGSTGLLVSGTAVNNPTVYSEELWFNTTTTSGGKLIGFGNATSGTSGAYDRHVWMLNTGALVFGTYTGQLNTAQSPASYNDGAWHHMVATQGADGMHLYVDGGQVASNPQASAQSYTGYWRVGGDNVWFGSSSKFFAGAVDETAVYSTELTAAQVRTHYRSSPAAVNRPPAASYTSTCNGLGCTFDASASSDPDGSIAGYAWSFGDGSSATGVTATHAYATGGSRTVTLTVTDDQGATGTSARAVNTAPLPADAYGKAVRADDPATFWRLDETAGPTAADSSPNGSTGTDVGGITYRAPSPVTGSGGTGYALNGGDGAVVGTQPLTNPSVYSAELWFTTTTTSGGKLVGFGNSSGAALSNNYDRHVYMLNSGQLAFGTNGGGLHVAQSAASYNDGAWHQVVATQGADGMHLYVDGAQVASDAATGAENYTGYWHVGGDNINGWPSAPASNYLAGTVDEAAFYTSELSADRVAAHYAASSARPNTPPVAAFTSSCSTLTCTVDGTGSSDPDGTVASYAWTFGDGGTATGATPSHTYTAAGTYTVTLTVTDDRGATNSTSKSVTATAPVNQAPVARVTTMMSALSYAFDASTSTDADGSITGYAWDFGDGTTGSGVQPPTHTYPAAGDYTVTLTVTDDDAATGSTSVVVSPRPPANAASDPFATDAFGRTVTGGLGTADLGGAWSTAGKGANLSVSAGNANFALPTTTTLVSAFLASTKVTDSDTTVTLTSDKLGTGSGMFAYVTGRRLSLNNEYRARVRLNGKTVGVTMTKLAGSASEVVLAPEVTVAGITYAPGQLVKVRVLTTGTNPTTLRVKVWPAAAAEPAAWTVSTTDTTAGLQAPGGVGLGAYLLGSATNAPITITYDAFSSQPSVSPTAAFTAACSGQACQVDGTASGDSTGAPSSWQWSWGDGQVTTASTPTSSHTYSSPGTYRITLTVTNASGRTAVKVRSVTVPG